MNERRLGIRGDLVCPSKAMTVCLHHLMEQEQSRFACSHLLSDYTSKLVLQTLDPKLCPRWFCFFFVSLFLNKDLFIYLLFICKAELQREGEKE